MEFVFGLLLRIGLIVLGWKLAEWVDHKFKL